ncbi:ATP-dependent DNA helicase PIF1 [Colletotrichum shisoi]|uniref:ATP-dependent DNA helicase PIF1 n=1 Tax=Colletotrichum shisoi TaxID=2078593 RepID=A0A5Q4BFR4_9PEZI|nr:ATP-dependent DNA helicase PIF1 [Colletotrichum shisoi]
MQKVCRKVDHPNNAAPVNRYATRYTATDRQSKSSSKSSRLLENCPTPRELHLKKGAHVMFVRNKTPSLINRTTRVVVSFASPSKNQDTARALSVVKPPVPIVRFSIDNGRLHTIPA